MNTIDDYTKYYLNIKTSYNNFISLHNHIFINYKKYNIKYNNIIVHKYILTNNINNNNVNNIYLYNDIIVYNNYIALFNHNNFNYIHIYTISNNVVKLYKSLDVSCMFYYCYANKKVRKTCIRIYMSIMHMHRSDCYMEGILSYINIEDIKNIKEYKEGMIVKYNSNNNINSNTNNINNTIIYDKYLNIINTPNTSVNDNNDSDIKLNDIPNNLIQDTFMIKIYKDNISIIKDDSTYINKKKIKIRKYEVNENKIYNLYKDKLQIIEIIE